MRTHFPRTIFVAATAAVVLAGCAAPTSAPTSQPTDAAPSPTATADVLVGLSLEQKVGQLFMVGTVADKADKQTLALVADPGVGSIFLSGRSSRGVEATAEIVNQFVDQASGPLFVATDQEGGEVQVLSGDGFDLIPSALEQGQQDPGELEAAASDWGSQLSDAGVNLNLGPVADVISGPDSTNQPIAALDRAFGYDAGAVDTHAGAVVSGLESAGVTATIKHFPGLGYVEGNTDNESGVTDTVTGPEGPTVQSFAALINGGAKSVMVSSAIYAKIDDSAPAVFSSAVVTDLLRDSLGFDGLILTDDLSGATQVQAWTPAERAILSIDAGVDIVLVTRTPSLAPEMMDAVVAKATDDPAFAAKVDTAARRVLEQKAALGL